MFWTDAESRMTLTELQTEAQSLDKQEQRKLVASLVASWTREDSALRQRMTEQVDDKDPSNWATLEELDRRLGLNEAE
ncbi:MAG: hypothetical protein ACI8W8_002115 [Rhodothermales bacterium]|jgi:hypothetical protein